MARVEFTAQAREDVRDLDGSARKLVLRAIKKLEDDPEKRGAPLGSQPTGDLTTFRKLVVGNRDCRVIYRVELDTVVVVWVVGARNRGWYFQLRRYLSDQLWNCRWRSSKRSAFIARGR